jgi:hypothetical protein
MGDQEATEIADSMPDGCLGESKEAIPNDSIDATYCEKPHPLVAIKSRDKATDHPSAPNTAIWAPGPRRAAALTSTCRWRPKARSSLAENGRRACLERRNSDNSRAFEAWKRTWAEVHSSC